MNKPKLTALLLAAAVVAVICVQSAQAYPPAGTDVISTSARVDLYDPGDPTILLETVILTGRAVIQRGNEYDPGDGRMKINTVLDTLYLEGYSIVYSDSMYVTLNRTMGLANGYIQQITAGIDYPAESFFDVFYLITLGPPAPNPPKSLGSVQGGFHIDDESGQGELEFQLTAGGKSYSVPLTPTAPPKPLYEGAVPEVDAAKARVGGDVIATATPIPGLPYTDIGSTVQYVNDYDEICPFSGSTAPDVVYSYQPAVDTLLYITLCNDSTDYDTKLYVYKNNASTLVDCNDDACSSPLFADYVSELQCVPVTAGDTFYIVVDGYGGASGTYDIYVDYCIPQPPCTVFCPPNAFIENEPCGTDANGGCNMTPNTFEPIKCGDTVCGTAWADTNFRDTDWYEFYLYGPTQITASGCAEFPMLIGFVDTADCALASAVNPSATGNPCDTVSATRVAGPGKYWMWVGPSVYTGYPCGTDNDYWAALTCVPQAQVVLINPDTVHMADTIWQIPPRGRVYKDPRKVPVIDPTTGDTIAYVWHEHRVNPPDSGTDTIPTTGTMVVWVGPNQPGPTQEPDDIIQLSGDAIVTRSAPDPEGTIQTEIVQMDLTGNSELFGPATLSLPQPAPGYAFPLTEEPFPAESFFDVYYQVEFPDQGLTIEPEVQPVMQADIEALPPYNRKYNPNPEQHPIFDVATGGRIGWVRPIHWVRPQVGACCDLLTGGCTETTPANCTDPNELFLGIGVPCDPNPCPTGPPPPPPADTVIVPTSGIMFVVLGPDEPLPGQPADDAIYVEGSATLGWGDPYQLPSGEWEYQTEIIQMDLSGQSHLFGQANLSLPQPAPGTATAVDTGAAFPMESFFDVYYQVDFPDQGQTIAPTGPAGPEPPHMTAQIDTIPPDPSRFDPDPEWHPVEDIQNPGLIIGWVRPIHFVNRSCCNTDGIRGDVNYDGNLNVADLTYLVNYLFKGGPPPPCLEEADVNGDGVVNVADLTYIVDYLFRGGPPPFPCP